jgi:hypothetical protein
MDLRESARQAGLFADPVTNRIAEFLLEIGLLVRRGVLEEATFLPGLRIEGGSLSVDEAKLLYPGDLLHEAAHLAVSEPRRRTSMEDSAVSQEGQDGGAEMAAIAWSYAAALHIGLDPAVVFHPQGYKGGSDSLLENFSMGRYVGVPLLQWMGMTVDAEQAGMAGVEPYPNMIAWLRCESHSR